LAVGSFNKKMQQLRAITSLCRITGLILCPPRSFGDKSTDLNFKRVMLLAAEASSRSHNCYRQMRH